jgi:ferritin-like metal-binding protein YciE
LIQQLTLIHRSETMLARELSVLFQRTKWLPLRLALSDQRRETNRHVDRLGCLIPMVGARLAPAVRPVTNGHLNGSRPAPFPVAAVIAGPLRASRAAVAAYSAAIGAATERGLDYAASLLTSSLTEEMDTTRRLALLAEEIHNQ